VAEGGGGCESGRRRRKRRRRSEGVDEVRWWSVVDAKCPDGSKHVPRTRSSAVAYRQSSVRGWRGANGFEIAEACARVALCVSRGGVEEVTYDLHDEFWFWWWGGTSELRVVR